jgi:hypothetical protein
LMTCMVFSSGSVAAGGDSDGFRRKLACCRGSSRC